MLSSSASPAGSHYNLDPAGLLRCGQEVVGPQQTSLRVQFVVPSRSLRAQFEPSAHAVGSSASASRCNQKALRSSESVDALIAASNVSVSILICPFALRRLPLEDAIGAPVTEAITWAGGMRSSSAILRNISIGRRPMMRRRSSFIINPESTPTRAATWSSVRPLAWISCDRRGGSDSASCSPLLL